MRVSRQIVNITAGEDIDFGIYINDSNGVALPLTGYSFVGEIITQDLAVTGKQFTCNLASTPNNLVNLFLSRSDSAGLTHKTYLCDLKMLQPDSKVRYPDELKLIIRVQHNKL